MPRCPECDEPLASNAINIGEGVALCQKCGQLSRLSDLIDNSRSITEVLAEPPAGCSVIPLERGVTVRASLHSMTGFLFPAVFALGWNGIISIFVLTAIAGLYTNLIGPLPDWFPAPPLKSGKPVMNGQPMELGSTLFLCVFLTPFVTIGVGMAGIALMKLVGRVDVVIDELQSYVATGVGFVTWKSRFDPRQVRTVRLSTTEKQFPGSGDMLIELQADRTLTFGSLLEGSQLEWLRTVLRELLLKAPARQPRSKLPVLVWIPRRSLN